jgi:DNA-binding NarL/FixJ family response regulator
MLRSSVTSSRCLLQRSEIGFVENEKKIRIMVVDDQAVVRQGFIVLVNLVSDMKVIAEAANGKQAVEQFRQHRPDVTLMDLRMPVMSGVEAIAAIRKEFPQARIIVLTTFDGDEDIYRSLQAGAHGYLLKDMFFNELEDAIRTVHAGLRRIPNVVADRLAERMTSSDLTSRELEVLEQIVKGKSNKEIGTALRISEATVKSHINNLLAKLGVTDRTQAATTAIHRGLVHLS